MKRLAAFLLVFVLLTGILLGTSAYASDSEELYNLYDKSENSYVAIYPFTNAYNSSIPLVLSGDTAEPVKWSASDEYIFVCNVDGSTDAQYYVCGTNNADYLKNHYELISYLDGKYVVEYELSYKTEQDHASVLVNYNYNYYIDAYINPDGTGGIDVVIYQDNMVKRISVMSEGDQPLSADKGEDLLTYLFGLDTNYSLVGKRAAVTLCITPGEDKLPRKIEMYVNGTKVATDNGKLDEIFTTTLAEYVPNMPQGEEQTLADGFGYMCALNCMVGVSSEIGNVRVYKTVSECENASSVIKYAQLYGNRSVDTDAEIETGNNGTGNNGTGNNGTGDNGTGNNGTGDDGTGDTIADTTETDTNETETTGATSTDTPSAANSTPNIIPLIVVITIFCVLSVVILMYGMINIIIAKKKK